MKTLLFISFLIGTSAFAGTDCLTLEKCGKVYQGKLKGKVVCTGSRINKDGAGRVGEVSNYMGIYDSNFDHQSDHNTNKEEIFSADVAVTHNSDGTPVLTYSGFSSTLTLELVVHENKAKLNDVTNDRTKHLANLEMNVSPKKFQNLSCH